MKTKTFYLWHGDRYELPVLTPLEQYVLDHEHDAPGIIARDLNRSERTINAAYMRAVSKRNDIKILTEEGTKI